MGVKKKKNQGIVLYFAESNGFECAREVKLVHGKREERSNAAQFLMRQEGALTQRTVLIVLCYKTNQSLQSRCRQRLFNALIQALTMKLVLETLHLV